MNPTPPQIDPVNAIVAVLTAFLSPAVAYVMGAYSVILISAAFGSGWALMRRDKDSVPGAIFFVVLMTGTATLTTVGVAEALNNYVQLNSVNLLLAPVALTIGAIGHDWPKVVPVLYTTLVDFILRNRRTAPDLPNSYNRMGDGE